jgi:ABC-type lipoprotein release transport system permease subunit
MELGFVKMGFRNAFRRKRIAGFTIFSIVLAVSLLYTSLSANANLERSANQFLDDNISPNDISVSTLRYGARITPYDEAVIRSIPGVEKTIARIQGRCWEPIGNTTVNYIAVGIDLEAESNFGSINATSGMLDLDEDGCFLSNEARELLHVSVGDELRLRTTSGDWYLNVTGSGFIIDKGLVGPVVIISLESASEIYETRYPDGSYNNMLIQLTDVFSAESIINQINSILNANNDDFVITNLKSYQMRLIDSFMVYAQSILLALVVSAVAIAFLRVFSSFAKVFAERRYETGVLLAFGGTPNQLIHVFVIELIVVGSVGAFFGAILGTGLGFIVLQMLRVQVRITAIGTTVQYFNAPYAIDFTALLFAAVAGVILTIFAGYLPAYRATREPVVKSLGIGLVGRQTSNYSMSQKAKHILWMFLILCSIILTCLVSVQTFSDWLDLQLISEDWIRIMSIPAVLITLATLSPKVSNSSRILKVLSRGKSELIRVLTNKNLRRNTISALVIFNLFSAITVLFFVSENAGYAVTETWRYTVASQTSTANVIAHIDPAGDMSIVEEVASLQNVTRVVPANQEVNFMIHAGHIETGIVLGVEPKGFEELTSIGLISSQNLSEGLSIVNDPMSCVISEYTALQLELNLGDDVTLESGYNVTVKAICVSSVPVFVMTVISPIFMIVGTETWSIIHESPFSVGSLLIETETPKDTASTLSEIPGFLAVPISDLQADILSNIQYIQLIMDSSLAVLVGVTITSAILSGWAIAQTRKREIGLLASMGLTDSEIAWSMTLETSVAMISGAILGGISGFFVELALADILLRFGGTGITFFDLRILLFICISVISSIIAAYFAILKTSDTEVVKLIRDMSRE